MDSMGVERAMKSLTRSLVVCGIIAILSSISMSLLLAWGARFHESGLVSFAVACERANTLALGIGAFVIVLSIGIMCVVLREFRRTSILMNSGNEQRRGSPDEKNSRK